MLKEGDKIYCYRDFSPRHDCWFEKGKWYVIWKFVSRDSVDVIAIESGIYGFGARYIFKIDNHLPYLANEYIWDFFLDERGYRKEKLKILNEKERS